MLIKSQLLTLEKLQHEAWESMTSQEGLSFESWKKVMISRTPTFRYWNIILQVLIFIRAHRQKMFVKLEALVPWFFALDHVNYARWIPIHIRGMKALPAHVKTN